MAHRLVIALLVTLLASCTPTSSGASSTSTTTKPPASTTTTPPPPPTTLGPLDLAVPSITSFRYRLSAATGVSIDLGTADVTVEVNGEFSAPDSHYFGRRVGFGGLTAEAGEAFVIGPRAWRFQNGSWIETTADDPSITDIAGPISSLQGNILPDPALLAELYHRTGVREVVGDVVARRYDIDASEVAALAIAIGTEFPELADFDDFAMVVWVDEVTGAPLRWRIDASGPVAAFDDPAVDLPEGTSVELRIEVDLFDLNDPGLVITPP